MKVKFARDGKEIGEYPEEAVLPLLESNVIRPGDTYWNPSSAGWDSVASRWSTAVPPLLAGNSPTCTHCGSALQSLDVPDKRSGLRIVAMIELLIGVGLLFLFPIGTGIGLIFLIAGWQFRYKQMTVWKCVKCGNFCDPHAK